MVENQDENKLDQEDENKDDDELALLSDIISDSVKPICKRFGISSLYAEMDLKRYYSKKHDLDIKKFKNKFCYQIIARFINEKKETCELLRGIKNDSNAWNAFDKLIWEYCDAFDQIVDEDEVEHNGVMMSIGEQCIIILVDTLTKLYRIEFGNFDSKSHNCSGHTTCKVIQHLKYIVKQQHLHTAHENNCNTIKYLNNIEFVINIMENVWQMNKFI